MQLEQELSNRFGFNSFRQGQKEIIMDVLAGNNVLATLPTGVGKSLCFQLPGLMMDGPVVVVTPLISLMEDQVKELKMKGFKNAVAVNSFNTIEERKQIIQTLATYKFIYLSPEILQNNFLVTELALIKPALFVIDEAHCISQWGHEFRPAYLKLNTIIKLLGSPITLALTATATPEVQQDIINQLTGVKFKCHIYPIDRPNLSFIVKKVKHTADKDKQIVELCNSFHVPTMIYFSSKRETERVCNHLAQHCPQLNVAFYHGDVPTTERILIQEQFMNNQLDTICCTSAFGMGINKQDVRLVIHYHLPVQIESFIQEVGRAGRDQLHSVSLTLVAPYDYSIPKHLIESEFPSNAGLTGLFNDLLELANQKAEGEINPAEIMNKWNLSEVQWRFVKNYLEKKQIINDNKVNSNTTNYSQILKYLTEKIAIRKRHKFKQLERFFSWINTDACRRIQLYQPFQSTKPLAQFSCCDYCGFALNQWAPVVSQYGVSTSSWQIKLTNILLPFDTESG
ncbi:ATP-dependent DNA helicase RecQ [Amphibacillus marinus]|uniref:ATP-dependent DNA helicase RecQ n=1 Tax=Amphibacillus marinus TaxID=872970 RepID=A0A1H8GCS6_9BACI|nr:RecQ family ATP-dependent DNA helicase [Amphibacillus marinus]SEN41961.1 ATP-dependent DNA helicase RecQ [Amphibacillus marinus]